MGLHRVFAMLAIAILLLAGTAVSSDQSLQRSADNAENEALEAAGIEIVNIIDVVGNNGSSPTIDSIPPGGVLLIPNSIDDNVGMYDRVNGDFLGLVISGYSGFATPINAIQGPDGHIYVSDQTADAVFVFDTSGTYLSTYADASDGLDNIRGIDFRGDHLFVTSGDDWVAEFDGPHSRLADFINDGSDPFDIMFLDDGQSLLCNIQGTSDDVRLYDANGVFVSSVISVSFPEQVQKDDLGPGGFLSSSFSDDVVTDFDLNGTIHQTTPWNMVRGAYRLENGNLLVTSSAGVFELDPGSGNIIEQKSTGSARFIEMFKLEPAGDPGVLMGTVADLQSNAIEGAIVSLGYRRDTTGVDGAYFFSLNPNTYSATTTAQYHNSVTVDDIIVAENETTVVDFALPTPLINVDTTPITLELAPGETITVQRNISNVGDGELEFNVSVNTNPTVLSVRQDDGIRSFGERILRSRDQLMSTENEYSPTYTVGTLPTILDFGDEVFMFDPETPTGDIRCLGVEFTSNEFWVTGANDQVSLKLYRFDVNGNLLDTYDQPNSSAWGWRDLAWDGQYLYSSDSPEVDIIDPATGQMVGSFNGPENPNRALAYDPATGHFWTGNFGGNFYEFDANGTINTYPNTLGLSVYGMAWDDVSEGGPFLWIFSQDGSPQMTFTQINPANGQPTGISFMGIDNGSGGIAGGCAFTTDFPTNPSVSVLFGLAQGTPDIVKGYEVAPFSQWLSVDPMSGILQPAGSVDIGITIDFTVDDVVPDSIYEATLTVENNTPDTPVIDVEVHATPTGIDETSGLPRVYSLAQNFPNPFNAQTNINFAIPRQSDVTIEIYNVLGQKTATLVEGLLPAGVHNVNWDASNVASGIYYYKLSAGDYTSVKMMTLLK